MQNMNLVACTAFGDWGDKSADSSLILGRNFDFYVNDDFAKNKILCFIKPDSGYKFVFITWAGFAGVVSGMNEKGLTITLNADKSSIPLGAKTPVSLLAREILQYSSDIDEAYQIAKSHETFVAESFLIGSAADHKAVVIEKSPEQIAIFDPDSNQVTVTNHYQSEAFRNDPLNVENMENETSVYRLKRIDELLAEYPKIDPDEAATVLRDYRGLGGTDIGLGNEKAVNQFIAHHSVIFQPAQRRIWVSGPPYQLGAYWAYDLDSISALGTRTDAKYCVPADTVQLENIYPRLQKYRTLAQQIQQGIYHPGDADSLIRYNPEFFETYRILGDYFKKQGNENKADSYYHIALEKEAPSAAERSAVRTK